MTILPIEIHPENQSYEINVSDSSYFSIEKIRDRPRFSSPHITGQQYLSDSPSQALLQETYSKIGWTLIQFQLLEKALKSLLPFINPDGSKKGVEGLDKYKSAISDKTLGPVFGEFNKSISVETKDSIQDDFLEKYLQNISARRNDLVHHLLKMPGMSLDSSIGCNNINSYLDGCIDDIENMKALLKPIARHIAENNKYAEYDEAGLLKETIDLTLSIKLEIE